MSRRILLGLGLCAAVLFAGAGCLVGANSEVHRQGTYVSQETLNRIEPGKTTAGWVLATLGPPSERSTAGPNDEILKYTYTETKDSSGYVFFIFGGHDSKVTSEHVFIEIKDGIVSRTWRG